MRAVYSLGAIVGLGMAAATIAPPANAHDWSIGVSIGVPGVVIAAPPGYAPGPPPGYYQAPPGYYQPRPGYYVAPTYGPGYYYSAPEGYYYPPLHYNYRPHPDWDRGYRYREWHHCP